VFVDLRFACSWKVGVFASRIITRLFKISDMKLYLTCQILEISQCEVCILMPAIDQ
jgi:hypothetical protein